MPEWLHSPFRKDISVELGTLAVQLALAFGLGCIVAGVYHLTHGRSRSQSAAMLPTLVLLTVLIAVVTFVIGDNVARAFSLVGVLGIVRFRTVVQDTRDVAFVIFAVAMGMTAGAGYLLVPLVGVPFVAVAAFLFRPRGATLLQGVHDFALTVRVGTGFNVDALLREPLSRHVVRRRLVATTTARQGVAFDVTYAVRLPNEDAAMALVTELNGIEGVQSVELRQA